MEMSKHSRKKSGEAVAKLDDALEALPDGEATVRTDEKDDNPLEQVDVSGTTSFESAEFAAGYEGRGAVDEGRRDEEGGVVLAARTFSLAAGNQLAGFPFQLLAAGQGCSPCLATEPAGTNYGFLSFESTSAAFASTALGIEGASLSSFPIEVLQ